MPRLATVLALLGLWTIFGQMARLPAVVTIFALLKSKDVFFSIHLLDPLHIPVNTRADKVLIDSMPKLQHIDGARMKLNPFPHLLRKISQIQQELITLWNAKILDHVSHQRALKHPVEAFNLWPNLSQNIDERLSRCWLCPELQALLSVIQRLCATEQRKLPSDESQKFKTISFMNTPVCNLISDHALNSVVPSKTLL